MHKHRALMEHEGKFTILRNEILTSAQVMFRLPLHPLDKVEGEWVVPLIKSNTKKKNKKK
jgi:hypothetical protein